MKVLFIGDIYGSPGRNMLKKSLPELKNRYQPDYIIANGENAAGGKGITPTLFNELCVMGIDLVTTGNHVFAKKEIISFLEDKDNHILRPLNYSEKSPGKGYGYIIKKDIPLAVLNVSGRVYMDLCDDPFYATERILPEIKQKATNILVDFHAEATSEKLAFAWHFDGRVSAVIGTHTHVQTADERILPFGTGYITDAGMTGPHEGIIGADRQIVIKRFMTGVPAFFKSQDGPAQLNGVYIEMCTKTGKTIKIERIYQIEKI